jgi:hypothetical protein
LEKLPIGEQFVSVEFCPSLHETLVPFRQVASDEHHRFDSIDRDVTLMVCVEMRRVMRCTEFREHPDDDPMKAAEFRHAVAPVAGSASDSVRLQGLAYPENPQSNPEFFDAVERSVKIWHASPRIVTHGPTASRRTIHPKRTPCAASGDRGPDSQIRETTMNFELDTLIAIAFFVPVAFFAVLNIVAFRTRGYESAVRPAAVVATKVAEAVPAAVRVNVEAANDSEMREAA